MLYRETVLADKPLAYWPCTEVAGNYRCFGKTSVDAVISSATRDGVCLSTPLEAMPGYNGSSDFASTAASTSLNCGATASVEIWIYFMGSPTTQQIFFDHTAGTGSNGQSFIQCDGSSAIYFQHGDRASGNNIVSWTNGASLIQNKLTHLVATMDSVPNLYIYANGVQKASNSFAGGVLTHTPNIAAFIGKFSGGLFTNARINHVALYDYALSSAQILEHYKVGIGQGFNLQRFKR